LVLFKLTTAPMWLPDALLPWACGSSRPPNSHRDRRPQFFTRRARKCGLSGGHRL